MHTCNIYIWPYHELESEQRYNEVPTTKYEWGLWMRKIQEDVGWSREEWLSDVESHGGDDKKLKSIGNLWGSKSIFVIPMPLHLICPECVSFSQLIFQTPIPLSLFWLWHYPFSCCNYMRVELHIFHLPLFILFLALSGTTSFLSTEHLFNLPFSCAFSHSTNGILHYQCLLVNISILMYLWAHPWNYASHTLPTLHIACATS